MTTKIILFTVQSGCFDTRLDNFPLVISSPDGDHSVPWNNFFIEMSDADRKKVKFFSAFGTTELYAEIEPGYDFAAKQVVYYVRADSVRDGDKFKLYYDSSFEENTEYIGDAGGSVAANVWDDDFVAVYHMANDPSGGAGCIMDSAGGGNHGTPNGNMLSGDLVSSDLGKAIDFDGTDDYISLPLGACITGSSDFTLEITARTISTARRFLISQRATGDVNPSYGLEKTTSDHLRIFITTSSKQQDVSSVATIGTASDDNYHRLSMVRDSAGTNVKLYIDGAVDGDETEGSAVSLTAVDMNIGRWVGGDYYWLGPIAEVRISKVARSSAWLKATDIALTKSMLSFEEVPDDVPVGWFANKGAGPWAFQEQHDKWGYPNNPRWVEIPEKVTSYTGREKDEPQIWTPPGGIYLVGDEDRHLPCGHWHKRAWRDGYIDYVYIYFLGETRDGYLQGVRFDRGRRSLEFIGNYPANGEYLRGLLYRDNKIVSVHGSGLDTRFIEITNLRQRHFEATEVSDPFKTTNMRRSNVLRLWGDSFLVQEEWGKVLMFDPEYELTSFKYDCTVTVNPYSPETPYVCIRDYAWCSEIYNEDARPPSGEYWDVFWRPVDAGYDGPITTYPDLPVTGCPPLFSRMNTDFNAGAYQIGKIHFVRGSSVDYNVHRIWSTSGHVLAENALPPVSRYPWQSCMKDKRLYTTGGVTSCSVNGVYSPGSNNGRLGSICYTDEYIVHVTNTYTANWKLSVLTPSLNLVKSVVYDPLTIPDGEFGHHDYSRIETIDNRYIFLANEENCAVFDIQSMEVAAMLTIGDSHAGVVNIKIINDYNRIKDLTYNRSF